MNLKLCSKILFVLLSVYIGNMANPLQALAATKVTTYKITVTQGSHGTISPGTTIVNSGASQTFTISPDSGYTIATVKVDGTEQSPVPSSYTFTNVTAAHTISATFVLNSYSIVATAGAHGSITPSGTSSVAYEGSQTCAIAPDTGYQIASVTVDGAKLSTVPSSYTFSNVTKNHTISATFAVSTFKITATAGAHGSITPSGSKTVDYNGSQAYTIKADSGYQIASVTVNGTALATPSSSYTFSNVTTDQTISAAFVANTYKITATAGAHGSITPSGDKIVAINGSQTYTITADSGYTIATVKVDGTEQSPVPSSYTFTNVTAAHTISATFAEITYTITATAGANGSITPSGVKTVDSNGSQTYTIKPDTGYQIATVTVNGTALSTTPTSYAFTKVTANQTISVTFAASSYNITATAGANGSITPTGKTSVTYGGSQTYTITPSTGYQIDSVTVNGTKLTTKPTSYTFTKVTKDQTISATFVTTTYKITATAGAHGSITPSGSKTVDYNGSQAYTIKADSGYQIASVTVNGTALATPSSSYTFSNVTTDQTISAAFVANTYKITATAGAHGSITPSGDKIVAINGSQTYTITADSGYTIATVKVDGTEQSPVPSSYTFTNVTAAHTISATFVLNSYSIVATAGAHGSITPSGTSSVAYEGSQTCAIAPDTGYQIASVTVDGAKLSTVPSSYTFSNVTKNHTISATFAVSTFKITATAGAHGSITPSGSKTVDYNGSQAYTIKADSGYQIASVTVNGTALATPSSSYTFSNVTTDQTISAAFVANTYKITATAGAHGSITPSGDKIVAINGSQTYTITADSGYTIATVKVDGTEQSPVPSSYTFTNVTAAHTISATFAEITYTITATAGANGSITPSGVKTVDSNGSQTYTIKPDTGYQIATVTVNGTALSTTPTSYAFTKVTANQTISVTFAASSYNITATAGANGSITPTGKTSVTYGGSQTYTITPSTGYQIDSVTVNGTKLTTKPTSYTFTKVTKDQTISATFVTTTYKITATAGAHGSITPSGSKTVDYNGSQAYTIKADSGYQIASVTVNGTALATPSSSYTFSNVTTDQTISAAFVANTYKITATAGAHGSITPSGDKIVAINGSQTYTITADSGYTIATVKVDGTEQSPVPSSYTFTNVTAAHTISVTFALNSYSIVATAGAHGSITPSGTSSVAFEGSLSYTITPNTGYQIAGVTVDGTKLTTTPSSYTFSNVIKNHTISVTFSAVSAAIKANAVGMALVQADTQAVGQAVNSNVVSLYQDALAAISQYQSTPNAANLTAAIQTVVALKPYNSIAVSTTNTSGVYDDALNQLIQVVGNNLHITNSVASINPPVDADNSFSSAVALDSGSLFISAPSYSANGFGTVYEFKKNSQNTWVLANQIAPNAPNPGDHFGRVFAVKGNMLVASAEPANGQAKVYIFARLSSGIWAQQDILELTTFSQLPAYQAIAAIHQITLAASTNAIGGYVVVGLPEYGKYMIFDQEFVYSPGTKQLLGTNWLLAIEGSLTNDDQSSAISVTADGDYVAIGSPHNGTVRILQATNSKLTHVESSYGLADISLTNWAADPGVSHDVHSSNIGFGAAVAIEQNPLTNQVTLAIGSPKENSAIGAVYTMVKGGALAKTFVWSSLSAVNILAPSTYLGIGSVLAMNGNMLIIDANSSPSNVMAYQLNANNQWAWAYSLESAYGSSLATDGISTAIGQQVSNGKSGVSQVVIIAPSVNSSNNN